MPRAKPTKPTRKMRQAALSALHDAVTDAAVPPYAKVRAATALLGADRSESSRDGAAFDRDPDAPRTYAVLPDKGNNPQIRYGLYDENQAVVIVPSGWPLEVHPESHYAGVPKPAALATRNRETLALPAPDEDEGE
jgi:hypothetical protein